MLRVIIFLLGLPFGLQAQSFSPCFSADKVRGCAPLTVKLTNCSGAAPNLVLYDFGEGAKPAAEHTYTKAGKYYITQYINSGTGGVKSDGSFIIEVSEAVNPTFEIQKCPNRAIIITIKDQSNNRYLVEYGDNQRDTLASQKPKVHQYSDAAPKNISVSTLIGREICGKSTQSVQLIDQIPAPKIVSLTTSKNTVTLSYQISEGLAHQLIERSSDGTQTIHPLNSADATFSVNRNLENKFYTYQIVANSPCDATNISSPIISTTQLNIGTSVGRNILVWTDNRLAEFEAYIVYKNNREIARFTSPIQVLYDDIDVKCGQRYCYKVVTKFKNTDMISQSSEECVVASQFSLPAPIPFIASTVNQKEKSIQLSWGTPNNTVVEKMFLHKSVNGNPPLVIEIPKGNAYTDTEVNITNRTYCYQVTYTDECGSSSRLSASTCPILLSLSKNLYNINLTWNSNDDTQFVYYIEKLNENGTIIQTLGPQKANNFSDERLALSQQINRYRIRAEGMFRPVTSYSNEVSFVQEARIIRPNAFSPNNDGLNDTFAMEGVFVKDFQMQIYNRWGNVVYVAQDIKEAWDGRHEGKKVPVGDYIYHIEFTDEIGNRLEEKGIVTVLY